MDTSTVKEMVAYDELYKSGKTTGHSSFRGVFLQDSENYFLELLQNYGAAKTALEIGCGIGLHSHYCANICSRVHGIDISAEAIKSARKLTDTSLLSSGRLEFSVGDAQKLFFSDNEFDLIINHEVFSSVDISIVIEELVRVLRTGGVVVSKETYGHNAIFNVKRRLNVLLGRRTAWAAAHIWRKEDFELAKQYFEEIEIKYFHLLVLFAAPLYFLPFKRLTKLVVRVLNRIDNFLLKIPILQPLAFKVVFVLKNPKGKS